jgi:serine/threonine protein kinase
MMRLDEFSTVVVRSGLLTSGDLKREQEGLSPADRAAPDAAVRLARRLIDAGKLTPYQARKLLAGVTKGFFLGDYAILRRLGEGGMGKVYLAVDRRDGRKVAIKVLPPKRAMESEQAVLRFRREMELSRRVRHPNIARTLEVGTLDGVHFMVLEYIPGDSLYHIVKGEHGGPLRVPDAARYFLKVIDGLDAAHAAGLVHRDIKPSNLMITPDGDAKVLDLGLARAMGDENPLTRPNVVIGTLDYASPEQLSDAARADIRSDLYSLGCTLYFTLAGRAPFEGGDVVNKIYKQRMEDPEPLERVARGVPTAFAAIVRKLMAKDPDERYQSCAELRADLSRWTDPARVKAILGAEAEAARVFRPPPPELDDDDLRLLPDPDGPSAPGISLRELGEADPSFAPLHKPPPPPRSAIVVPDDEVDDRPGPLPAITTAADESPWLVPFVVTVSLLGLLAILLIALLR